MHCKKLITNVPCNGVTQSFVNTPIVLNRRRKNQVSIIPTIAFSLMGKSDFPSYKLVQSLSNFNWKM